MIDSLNKDLYFAVANDDIDMEAIDRLLNLGADPEGYKNNDYYGETAFLLAVKKNRVDILEKFVAYGADINSSDNEGDTALMLSVQNPSIYSFNFLIEAGADVNICNQEKTTALIKAVDLGLDDFSLKLIKAGADVNAYDENCNTPLTLAAFIGNVTIAEALLAHGADPYFNDCFEDSAFSIAKENKNKEFLELLQKWSNNPKKFKADFFAKERQKEQEEQRIKLQKKQKIIISKQRNFRKYINNKRFKN